MKTKFLLPVLAMVFAIGMSFATEKKVSDPGQDYIQINGTFMPLGTELDCGNGSDVCQVRLENGQVHEVYDAPDPNSLKIGDGIVRDL